MPRHPVGTLRHGLVRYRCRVGHIYSVESMLEAQTDSVNRALWTTLRWMEERAALTHRLAERAKGRKHHSVARAFAERASVADGHAAVIRELLVSRAGLHEVPETKRRPRRKSSLPRRSSRASYLGDVGSSINRITPAVC